MTAYRRPKAPGATWFFTVALQNRSGNDLLVRHVAALREAVRATRLRWPFEIEAWVVLPDHLHALWTLPEKDQAIGLRWSRIKAQFSRSIPRVEPRSRSRQLRGERGIWQRRFWEHLIRDDRDFEAHMDYIHYNPVKHGLVDEVARWPYSSFHRLRERGIYPEGWGQRCPGAPSSARE